MYKLYLFSAVYYLLLFGSLHDVLSEEDVVFDVVGMISQVDIARVHHQLNQLVLEP